MTTAFDSRFFNEIWEQVLLMMKERMSGPTFETWFTGTRIASYDEKTNRLVVHAPNSFTRNWLQNITRA